MPTLDQDQWLAKLGVSSPLSKRSSASSPGSATPGAPAGTGQRARMQADCKIVRGAVPGPKNHVLCGTHRHILDSDAGVIIAKDLEEYKRVYGSAGAHHEGGKAGAGATGSSPKASDGGRGSAGAGPTAQPPPALATIPVPTVSGDCKAMLVNAMRTVDSIQPSDAAGGLYIIVIDGKTKQITQKQVDEIRGKSKSKLKQNIGAVKGKAESAKVRYDEQQKVNKDQWAVSAAATLAKKITTLGKFADPGPTLKKEVETALAGAAAAAAAADAGTFVKAAECFADAEAAALKAAKMSQAYVDGLIDGAGMGITALEDTRDLAFATLTVLSIVATAGVATGAIGATSTVLGVGVGGTTAAAGFIAATAPKIGEVLGKASVGDKVNWGEAAADIAVELIKAKFGEKWEKGLSSALTKRLGAKLAAEGLARIAVEKLVPKLIVDKGPDILEKLVVSTCDALKDHDVTFEQVIDKVIESAKDPKGPAKATLDVAIEELVKSLKK